MANTTGGSFWKNLVEYGSDIYDDVSDWWKNVPEGPSFLTTGIGGRPIMSPDSDLSDLRNRTKGQQGWDWLSDLGSDIYDYGKQAYGYAKDLYDYIPSDVREYGAKYLKDKFLPAGGSPDSDDKDRPRSTHQNRKLASKYGHQSVTPGFSARRSRTAWNTKSTYGQAPIARKAMQLAALNKEITRAQLAQIQQGRRTISLDQVGSTSPRLVGRFTQNIT